MSGHSGYNGPRAIPGLAMDLEHNQELHGG